MDMAHIEIRWPSVWLISTLLTYCNYQIWTFCITEAAKQRHGHKHIFDVLLTLNHSIMNKYCIETNALCTKFQYADFKSLKIGYKRLKRKKSDSIKVQQVCKWHNKNIIMRHYLCISCVEYSLNEENISSTIKKSFSLLGICSGQLVKCYTERTRTTTTRQTVSQKMIF